MRSILVLTVIFTFFFQGCDLLEVVEFQEPNRYEGCCGISAVVDTIGDTRIAIPNAVTPNADGLNDAFAIYSTDVMQITSLRVTEQNDLLGIDRKDIPLRRGWTQIWIPRNVSGKIVQGLFNYSVTLKEIDGEERTLTGQFCAFICGEDKVETIPLSDCHFRNQVNENGQFSSEIPSQDTCSL